MNPPIENISFDSVLEEKKRLSILKKYDIDDYEDDIEMDTLAKLVANICNTPISTISFLNATKLVFKGTYGFDLKTIDRTVSFCQYTVM
ncbi:MAG TPA: hypothetical protein VK766_10400, partial [Cytophagaceae bacterium]|nr:hypothetical protein [Cytophagaceae bacterium]